MTNALLYTEGPISVRLQRDRTLLCEVNDASETTPRLRAGAQDDDGGRGLHLVKELSNRWGTRRTTTGKTVWFELALTTAVKGGLGPVHRPGPAECEPM